MWPLQFLAVRSAILATAWLLVCCWHNAHETCTRNMHVHWSVLYKFMLKIVSSASSLNLANLSVNLALVNATQDRNCSARDTNCATWLAGELLLCKKLWWTCVKFFMQVSCTSFWYKFVERLSLALVSRMLAHIYYSTYCWMSCHIGSTLHKQLSADSSSIWAVIHRQSVHQTADRPPRAWLQCSAWFCLWRHRGCDQPAPDTVALVCWWYTAVWHLSTWWCVVCVWNPLSQRCTSQSLQLRRKLSGLGWNQTWTNCTIKSITSRQGLEIIIPASVVHLSEAGVWMTWDVVVV